MLRREIDNGISSTPSPATRVACPKCGKMFNYHIYFGVTKTYCSRCGVTFKTRIEYSTIEEGGHLGAPEPNSES